MQSTTTLELNLQYPNHATTMYAVQNDRLSRKISAVLADGATAWTPPTGTLAIVRFVKPDGTMGFYDTDENDDPAVTWTGNVATITLAEQVLTVAGDVWCQVNFYNAGEERLSTFKWVIKVQENVITDETIESTDYFNILTHQIDEIIEAITDMPIPSTSNPVMDGTASPGSASGFARGDHVHPSDTSRVPTTRKVNNKALSSDITLSASDVGAVPTTRKVNNKALSGDITLSASDVDAVPTSRTVNGKALSSNATINASDIPNDSTVSGENVDDALDTLDGAIKLLVLESTNDSTDRTTEIVSRLTNNKKCILGKGTFYTTGIDMPDGSTLIGMGDATVLHKTGSGSYVINMNKDNVVDGICIDGNDTVSSTIGDHHGILWNGDYSTSQDSSLQPKNGKLSNLTIKNFNGGGITCNDTGHGRDNNILAVNIAITNCNVGINIPFVSEYHKFTNVDALECYYGCINNGGNNSFIGCDFSNSKTAAFVIDNSNDDKTNNSHGSAVACFFNHVAHSGGNLQDGLYLNKVSHGFIFSGCQFFDCALEIIGCNGVEITDSIFGSSIPITIDGGKGTVFAENSFQNPPTISITNNALAYFRNCIRRDNGYYIAETGQGILTANTEWNFPVVSGYKSGDNIYLYIPTTAETGTTHNIAVSNVTGTLLGSDGSTLANNENLTSACQYLQLYSVGRGMVMRLYKSGGWGNAQDIVMVCGVVKITASVPIK